MDSNRRPRKPCNEDAKTGTPGRSRTYPEEDGRQTACCLGSPLANRAAMEAMMNGAVRFLQRPATAKLGAHIELVVQLFSNKNPKSAGRQAVRVSQPEPLIKCTRSVVQPCSTTHSITPPAQRTERRGRSKRAAPRRRRRCRRCSYRCPLFTRVQIFEDPTDAPQ